MQDNYIKFCSQDSNIVTVYPYIFFLSANMQLNIVEMYNPISYPY